jgi:transcriptional regulator with XRE-family HTH domain
MSTASDTAPAARGSLERGADSQLKAERVRQGLTRKELAARVGMSVNTLIGIENGHQRPAVDVAGSIAAALEVELSNIFELVECECGCGGKLIDMPRHGSQGRFLSGHNARQPEHGASVTRGHAARRARLGIPESKICKGCGREYTRSEVPRQSNEHWLAREYCPDGCRWPKVEPRPCKFCGEEFRPDENRRHYCPGTSHGQLDRFKRGDVAPAFFKEMPSLARKRWGGRWGGSKPPAPGSRPRGHPPVSVTEEQKRRIKLASKRWGRRRIAQEFGISERAVRNVLDEL